MEKSQFSVTKVQALMPCENNLGEVQSNKALPYFTVLSNAVPLNIPRSATVIEQITHSVEHMTSRSSQSLRSF